MFPKKRAPDLTPFPPHLPSKSVRDGYVHTYLYVAKSWSDVPFVLHDQDNAVRLDGVFFSTRYNARHVRTRRPHR